MPFARPSSRVPRLVRAVAFAAACAPLAASAREVEYRAPAGCPSRDEVAARLEASSPEGRAVRIEVRRIEVGFSGEVVLGDGETRVLRTVDARTCVAVVEALALIIALDHAPPSDEPADTPPLSTPPVASPLSPSPSPARDAVAPTHPPADSAPPRVVLAFGATVSGTSFAAGAVLPGGALFLDVASTTGLGEVRWLRPSARLSVGRTLPTVAGEAAVQPEFTITAVSIDACPIGFAVTAEVGVVACGRAELGAVRAGAKGDASSTTSRLWQAGGAIARTQWVLLSAGTLRPMIELSGGVIAPLQRDRFHFGALATSPTLSAPSYEGMLAISGGVVLP
jgi:hypothetical protein